LLINLLQSLQVKLQAGLTWDNATVLGVWSEKMAGAYGHVVLQPEGAWPSQDPFLNPGGAINITGDVNVTGGLNMSNGTLSSPTGNLSANGSLLNNSLPVNYTEGNAAQGLNVTGGALGVNGSMSVNGSLSTNGSSSVNDSLASNSSIPQTTEPPMQGPLRGKPQPTSFDSCIELSPRFRLRWTVDRENNSVDIGLESALADQQFMALGWAVLGALKNYMGHADVVVAGFDNKRRPYAEDYFVTALAVCTVNTGSPQGVCPDADFAGPNRTVSNVQLVYAQQMDGETCSCFVTHLFLQFEVPLVPSKSPVGRPG
jgi:hypothetical protein